MTIRDGLHPSTSLRQAGAGAFGGVTQPKDMKERQPSEVVRHDPVSATGLPSPLKNGIESLSGLSMANVRVHYNSTQPTKLDALAYAQGTDIHLAAGQERHLPHEAWHVVQQARGSVRPTMQMKDGVSINNDATLEHEADVMGAKAIVAGQGTMSGTSSGSPASRRAPTDSMTKAGATVQRIVRLAGAQVPPSAHDELVARVRARFAAANVEFLPEHESTLRGWATEHDHVIAAPTIDAIAFNLYMHSDEHARWSEGMTRTQISNDDMRAAKATRSRDRFARVMEPTKTATTLRVPGLGKLGDTSLLRLQDVGLEEEQYWLRPDEVNGERLDTVKRKGISNQDEVHITACGDKDDPSYVVALNNHHLGHRYVGSGRQTGTGNPRTYGSKKDREGYEYKGSGLVDGHAIQVQDDQQILGPFQGDAEDWTTTIKKIDGSTVSYEDKAYLPKDEHDPRMIEAHPHNFYWENQGQGQRMRQKAIEAPAMKSGASFLHYNVFTGETFHPNTGRATDHTYELASRVHYLHTAPDGSRKHYSCDNRAVADYSNHGGYDVTTHRYPDIPSGVPQKGENASLGGLGASEHLKLAEMPDTTQFPYATVLHPAQPDFSFKPEHRQQVSGYESPPPSPYWAPQELEDDERVVSGDHSRRRHFHDDVDGALIVDTSYDAAKNETTLKRKKRRIDEITNWPEGGGLFERLEASRTIKKQMLSTHAAPEQEEVAADAAFRAERAEAIRDHQRRIDLLAATLNELQASIGVQHANENDALRSLVDRLVQVDRDDPARASQVGLLYLQAIAWFRGSARLLYRDTTECHHGEPGHGPLGESGERLASLRQYFSECAQMAVHNVLALSAGGGELNESLLDQHGTFGQDLSEDHIRQMLEAAGRPDLPVIGSLGDLQGLLNEFDTYGDLAADFYGIGITEQIGHDSIRAFGMGHTNVLSLVVNTQAATAQRGTHWIAVQLHRQPDGQVAVTYLDSYDAPTDYRYLFDGLRAFFGAVRPNVPVQIEVTGQGDGDSQPSSRI